MKSVLDDVLDHDRLVTALMQLATAHPGWRYRRVPFRTCAADADAFAAALVTDVRTNRFVAGAPRHLRLPGGRQVALVPLPDLMLADAFAAVLAERAPPDAVVWSYRPGVSTAAMARAVAAHIRAERRRQRDQPITQRAVFAMRQDVKACSDSIRVDDDAALWRQLQGALTIADHDPAFVLLKTLIRPRPRRRGILQGTPLNNVLVNLHLRPIDDALRDRPGCLYARFGDDTALMAPTAAALQSARLAFGDAVASLSLNAHDDKGSLVALTPAGRDVDGVAGAQHIDLVGVRLNADGTIALKPAHARALVRAVARRSASAVSALTQEAPGATVDAQLTVAVRAAMTALQVERADAPGAARLLREVVTCRSQLAWLDRALAGAVAAAVAGQAPPRAFRTVRWEAVRAAGLRSVVEARNGG